MRHERIEKLTRQLLDLGYHSGQIKQIITEAVESAAESGSPEERIVDALESYVSFAIQCCRSGSRKERTKKCANPCAQQT